jgi:hypothetical protein
MAQITAIPSKQFASQEVVTPTKLNNTAKPLVAVESIADLRLVDITGLTKAKISVLGYYAAGDGGGGPERFLVTGAAPGTYTDNGGSIIVPTGGDGSAAWLWEDRTDIYAPWLGAMFDGTDDSANWRAALTAASGKRLIVPPGTLLATKSASAYVFEPPANTQIVGVRGKSIIKLNSAAASCYIFGSASEITSFDMEGITLDVNTDDVTGDVWGMYFPNIHTLRSRFNTYLNIKRSCMTAGLNTLADDVLSERDVFTSFGEHGVQTYNGRILSVIRGTFTGCVKSAVDTNPLTAGTTNVRTKTAIIGNVINCGDSWTSGFSVLSLMGDDIEATGNKITKGGNQIIIHDGTTETLKHYSIRDNFLWDSTTNAILVNGDVNSGVVVSGNHIKGCAHNAIYVIGGYSGTGVPVCKTVISDNTIEDGSGTYTWTDEKAAIRLNDTANVSAHHNIIQNPRFAGIEVLGSAKNISLTHNTIDGHKGQAPTDLTARYGGAIIATESSTVSMDNILIEGNVINRYMVDISGGATNIYSGGIVLVGLDGDATKLNNITVKNNHIHTGNGVALRSAWTTGTVLQGNVVIGSYSADVDTATGNTGIRALDAVEYLRVGATGSRPTIRPSGWQYWDTTIDKPVWWDGDAAEWVDATGGAA